MPRVSELRLEQVEFMPDDMENGVIYVSDRFETAVHLCACGCGVETITPFKDPHGWSLKTDDGKVTLHPSIGNMAFPCGSHYWVRDGKIVWC